MAVAEEGDGEDDKPDGIATGDSGDGGMNLSSPNRASWINGLATLLGGDPLKNGGDEATCGGACSTPQPPPWNKIHFHFLFEKEKDKEKKEDEAYI